VLLSLSVCCLLRAQNAQNGRMSLGVDSIHTDENMCLMLGATAAAGDFFKDLRARDTSEGRTFQKHAKVVRSFPERLTVKIVAGLDSCVGNKKELDCDRCEFRLNDEFMSSLQFEAYWKHGFDMQKAEVEVLSAERSNDLARVEPSAKLWNYELSVKSENIPLSDSLAVVILTPDGRVVSRLSGRL
jgi:hypothetical protein